jgi:tRNA nucleotidyltransferase (CCA-adding enzyme)
MAYTFIEQGPVPMNRNGISFQYCRIKTQETAGNQPYPMGEVSYGIFENHDEMVAMDGDKTPFEGPYGNPDNGGPVVLIYNIDADPLAKDPTLAGQLMLKVRAKGYPIYAYFANTELQESLEKARAGAVEDWAWGPEKEGPKFWPGARVRNLSSPNLVGVVMYMDPATESTNDWNDDPWIYHVMWDGSNSVNTYAESDLEEETLESFHDPSLRDEDVSLEMANELWPDTLPESWGKTSAMPWDWASAVPFTIVPSGDFEIGRPGSEHREIPPNPQVQNWFMANNARGGGHAYQGRIVFEHPGYGYREYWPISRTSIGLGNLEDPSWLTEGMKNQVRSMARRVWLQSKSSKTGDYQGWTNWDTWHTALLIGNEQDLHNTSVEIVRQHLGVDALRDWAIRTVVGPHNKQSIEDAQEWNDIPPEERIDYSYEDLKNDSPDAADLANSWGFGPDVSDTDPMIMDEMLINWDEIYNHIKGDLEEEDRHEQGLPPSWENPPDPDAPGDFTLPEEWTSKVAMPMNPPEGLHFKWENRADDFTPAQMAIIAYDEDQEIGELQLGYNENSENYWIAHIKVEEPYQRRGIGTLLLQEAERRFGPIQHDWDHMTAEGEQWAQQVTSAERPPYSTVFHVAPKMEREEILRHGIDSSMSESNWRGTDPEFADAPHGNYVWSDADTAFNGWGQGDVWEIETEPYEWKRDPYAGGAWYTEEPIRPEHIRLAQPADYFRESAILDKMASIGDLLNSDPAANAAYQALTAAGGTVWIVGGAVRDSVMGKDPKDIDLMVGGLEDTQIEGALQGLGKLDFTGKQFGVYRFKTGGSEVEIALPRTERSTGTGHKDFEVTADPHLPVEEDLRRRDFTANAMAYEPATGQLIDPHGGQEDIHNGVLRTVSPNAFKEDPLRTVRALSANSRFGLDPDEATHQQMSDNAHRIRHLPGDRIQAEMDKLLTGSNPAKAIATAEDSGLLQYLIPELSSTVGFDQQNPHHDLDVFAHTLKVLEKTSQLSNDPDLRLAALFHDAGKPDSFWLDEAQPDGGGHFYKKILEDGTSVGHNHEDVGADLAREWMTRNRYPTDRIEHVTNLVQKHMFAPFASPKGARRFLASVDGDVKTAFDLLSLREADASGKSTGEMSDADVGIMNTMRSLLQEVVDNQSAVTIKDLAINGHDLMEAGIKPGPQMGEILRGLLDKVIEQPELNNKETLLGLVHGEAK